MLFVIAAGLILAWKVAGHFGADYFLLRWLGTPWQAGARAGSGAASAGLQPAAGEAGARDHEQG